AAAPFAPLNLCGQGWISYGSRCFRFISSSMRWFTQSIQGHRPQENCNNMGGHLASVTNPQEYNYLQQITQCVVGGLRPGRWMWIDRQGFYYNYWSSQASSTTHSCIYLRSSTGWSNTVCSSGLPFICSKNLFSC
uniref:C-type lectin domain-containing protein n=1 Tax=Gouania willdenowi TaxID=441366 RepID=A0A8C5D2E8_GOUWI